MKRLIIDALVFDGFGMANVALPAQKAFFRECILDIDEYYDGTINVFTSKSIVINKPPISTGWIRWDIDYDDEMFLFMPCKIKHDGLIFDALIYMASNSPHFSSTRKWEIITKQKISGIKAGTPLKIIFADRIADVTWGCIV